jgi:AcrR family transcriptional regulator
MMTVLGATRLARDEQKMRSEQVRQAILDTAYDMGLKEGFEAVSIRKIISRMKYSTGVVYHYFKDKQEILDAIEETETKRLHEMIVSLIDPQRDYIENMSAVFRRVMRLAYEEPEKYNLIVLHKYSRHNPSRPAWISEISRNLQKCMEAGAVRALDAEKAAFAVWSSFLGFNLMISRHQDMTLAEAEALFDVQLDIILHGILNQNEGK